MSDDSVHSPPPEYILEENKPFSQSLIWQFQRQFYIEQGTSAWNQQYVPFGITTNSLLAMAYSRVIYGFLRDWLPNLDLSERVYIVEVGAGSGRLGFNVLNQLEEFYSTSAVKHVRYQYILTDLAEKNVEFWKTHPQLAPFVEAGKLDFARFDLVSDTQLTLEHTGKILINSSIKNPVIVLANYIWDSLPADLFYVENGELFEVQAGLMTEKLETDLTDPDLINRIEVIYDRFPTTSDFYDDPEMQPLLELYRQQLKDTMLIFPHITLQCVRQLQRLSNNRMMLLTADKGDHRLENLQTNDVPFIVLHNNGFSIESNYHAFMKYFEQKGGTVLTTTQHYKSINILACLLGGSEYAETRHAYNDYIERLSPDDLYLTLMDIMTGQKVTLSSLLSYVRLKQYDTHAFVAVYDLLLPLITEQYTYENALNLKLMLQHVWRNYYHMNERYNLPLAIATILQKIHDFGNALGFYNYAIQLYGTHLNIRMNMAVCHMKLGHRQLALDLVKHLLVEMPDNPELQQIRVQVEAMPV